MFYNSLYFQAVLVLILSVFVWFTFKPVPIEVSETKKRAQFWEGFKEIKNIKPELLFFLLSLSFVSIAATNVDKYLDVYFVGLGYQANELGNFKMVVGIVSLLAGIILVPLFMKIKQKLVLISIFQILSALIIFTVFRASGNQFIMYIYSIFMIYISVKAVYVPIEQSYIAGFSSHENIATTMGIRQSFLSIGTIIGPFFGAFIYDYNPLLLFDVSIIFFILSMVLLVISALFRKQNKAKMELLEVSKDN